MRPVLPVLALALILSACGSEKKAEGAGSATGEILPGSASDAMLPLDTVRSQAPLAPKVESTGKAAEDKGETGGQAAEGEPPAAAEPTAEPADPAEG
jgi:hypothetical protein